MHSETLYATMLTLRKKKNRCRKNANVCDNLEGKRTTMAILKKYRRSKRRRNFRSSAVEVQKAMNEKTVILPTFQSNEVVF